MKKRSKKMKRQMKTVVDAFACSQAVDSFAMAFNPDEPRKAKGEKGGGQWTSSSRTYGGGFKKRERTEQQTQLIERAAQVMTEGAKAYDAAVKQTASEIRSLKKHPMYSKSDYKYLRDKGYGPEGIKAIWDRDHAAGKSPQEHAKAPDVVGYLNSADIQGAVNRVRSKQADEARKAATGDEAEVRRRALQVSSERNRKKKKPTGLSLSFGSATISLSHGESETQATKDPLVFWKEVAHAGTFFKGNQRIDITPNHIKHWEKTHKQMSQAGITVPVPLEHTKDPEKRRGKVLAMSARPNSRGIPALYAKIKFRDQEAAKLKDSGCSIWVPSESPCGDGRVFRHAIEHVCVTDYPVIPDLEPFTEAIALSHTPPNLPFPQASGGNMISGNPEGQNMATVISRTAPLTDVLVMNAAARPGAREGISLSFPPKSGEGAKEPDGDEKGSKDPAGATPPGPQNPAQAGNNPPSPNGATQKLTLRDLATQLGLDPSITDETQLLTLLSNTIMQLKARAQAPMPPQPMPGQPPVPQQPGVPHPQMMPGMPPGQPMMPPRPPAPPAPGAYGPPAMHTGRPPVAMSQTKRTRKEFLRSIQQQQEEGVSLSLEDIPQEIVMALSKKQMKKVIKTIKKSKGGKGGDVVQKLNDKSHFGSENDECDETFEDDNDTFGEENIGEGEEENMNPSGAAAGGLSMLSGSILNAVKNARMVTIDDLFRQGIVNGAVRKDLIADFVEGQGVALSHHYDDGFDREVARMKKNGRVMPSGVTGPQGAGVVALSNGELSQNALEADAARRANGQSNL